MSLPLLPLLFLFFFLSLVWLGYRLEAYGAPRRLAVLAFVFGLGIFVYSSIILAF